MRLKEVQQWAFVNKFKCIFDTTGDTHPEFSMLHLAKTFYQMNEGQLLSTNYKPAYNECEILVEIYHATETYHEKRAELVTKTMNRALSISQKYMFQDGFVNNQTRPLGQMQVLSITHQFHHVFPNYSEEGIAMEEEIFKQNAHHEIAKALSENNLISFKTAGNNIYAEIVVVKDDDKKNEKGGEE